MATPRERLAAELAARDRMIRKLRDRGWTQQRIAARYSISRERVRQIIAAGSRAGARP